MAKQGWPSPWPCRRTLTLLWQQQGQTPQRGQAQPLPPLAAWLRWMPDPLALRLPAARLQAAWLQAVQLQAQAAAPLEGAASLQGAPSQATLRPAAWLQAAQLQVQAAAPLKGAAPLQGARSQATLRPAASPRRLLGLPAWLQVPAAWLQAAARLLELAAWPRWRQQPNPPAGTPPGQAQEQELRPGQELPARLPKSAAASLPGQPPWLQWQLPRPRTTWRPAVRLPAVRLQAASLQAAQAALRQRLLGLAAWLQRQLG